MASSNGHGLQIPVIDISHADEATGDEMVDAAARYGFLYIRANGTNFTSQVIDRTFALACDFFESPLEEKAEIAIPANENKGWSSMHSETLDPEHQKRGDFKEALNLGEFIDGKAQQKLPKSLAAHEAEMSRFAHLCHGLCMKILELFALGLKIDNEEGGKGWFSSRHDPSEGPSGTVLRFLHYPSLPEDSDYDPETDVRAGPHSDYGTITLLFQRRSQPGLEILTSDSTWLSVPATPPGTESDPIPPILVNVADLLSYWTNGLLKSAVHRVIVPRDARDGRQGRYSIAYFLHPADRTRLVPIPSELVRTNVAEDGPSGTEGARAMTAGEHLHGRLAATYGWDKQNGDV